MKIPLLIGGATTSKMHAAVKVAPQYFTKDHPVIHVLDASRSVVVVGNLMKGLDHADRLEYVTDVSEEYDEMRCDYYDSLDDLILIPFEKAIDKSFKIDYNKRNVAPKPNVLGAHVVTITDLNDVLEFIDWNPFFQTWELRGRYPNRGYPKIFDDEFVGEEAAKLFKDAQVLLKRIVDDKLFYLKGIYGLYRANRVGEDVHIFEDSTDPTFPIAKFCMLRQQNEKEKSSDPYLSQADFIAPIGYEDHLGMFAVGCFGIEELGKEFDDALDDYNKILAQALGDRLVEAFAEKLHRDIRVNHWGYASDEDMNAVDLLKIKYDGIRPAPGYPSQPDHTEKRTMWKLMNIEELTGIQLTESLAMKPAASVSALVFAHPDSTYFAVGKIDKDQVESYANRKEVPIQDIEKWLSPILNYEREDV